MTLQTRNNIALAIGSIVTLALFVRIGPTVAIGVTALILLAILAMEWPKQSLYAVIAIQIMMPIYVLVPPVGGLPNLPVSLLPLAGVMAICLLASLLKPEQVKMGGYGQVLMATLYLFALILFVSIAYENSIGESFNLWIRVAAIPLSLCWMGVRLLRTVEDVQKLFYVLMFAGVCVSGFAVSEYLMGRNILIEKLIMSTDSSMKETMSHFYLSAEELSGMGSLIYRCSSVFINAIEFGSFMTMVAPFPLVAAVLATGKRRWLYGIIAAICLLGVLLSFSRGPILTSVLQVFGLAILLRPLRRLVIGAVIVIALAITLSWPMIGDSITSRFKEQDNVTLRFKLWEMGWHIFTDNPVLGVGLGNFPKHQNQTERDYRVGPILEWGGNIDHIATVDNTYIQLAAETGLLGFFTFMSSLWIFLALTLKLYKHSLQKSDDRLKALALGVGFGVFGYFFNAITYTAYNFFVVTPSLFILYSSVIVLERSLNSTDLTPRFSRCA